MLLLNHVDPKEATGKLAEAYSVFPPQIPVPEPLIMMSASPEIAAAQSGIIRHFITHEKLDMGLLAMIRYLVAKEYGYQFCINLNSGILKQAGGMTDEDLQSIRENPENAPLEDFQKALLLFVLKVIQTPDRVQKEDIDRLHELGWSDSEIFDAAYHAASMVSASILYKAFSK